MSWQASGQGTIPLSQFLEYEKIFFQKYKKKLTLEIQRFGKKI